MCEQIYAHKRLSHNTDNEKLLDISVKKAQPIKVGLFFLNLASHKWFQSVSDHDVSKR